MNSRVLKPLIIVFWVVMISWYGIRAYSTGPTAGGGQDLLRNLGPEEGQEWFGIYIVGVGEERMKVGFSISEAEELQKTRIIKNKSWMRLTIQGSEKTVRTETKILTDLEYRMINLNFIFSTDTIKFEVLGTVEEGQLRLKITTAAGDMEKIIPMDEPPLMPETIMAKAVAEGLEVGKTFQMPLFDPVTFNYTKAEVRVAEQKPGEGGKVYWLLKAEFKGVLTETWIDQDGKVLQERAANFLTVRETKKEALNDGWAKKGVQEDILDQSKIKVDKEIPNARTSTVARLRLKDIDFAGLALDGGRQAFDPETGIVTITRENIDESLSYTLPMTDEAFEKELEGTPTIQTKDIMIVQQKDEILVEQTDALKAAKLIHKWVFENLDKKPLVSIPSARDVLEIKRGDCNEHAALFTALARSAGIPTKIVVGVVYQQGSFYYHAWNAVWVGQWVEVDATFGQFPSDATHLRLLEGDLDKQIELIRVIGKLNIEVLSVQ